jgi:hypothetical protein
MGLPVAGSTLHSPCGSLSQWQALQSASVKAKAVLLIPLKGIIATMTIGIIISISNAALEDRVLFMSHLLPFIIIKEFPFERSMHLLFLSLHNKIAFSHIETCCRADNPELHPAEPFHL